MRYNDVYLSLSDDIAAFYVYNLKKNYKYKNKIKKLNFNN